jgi:ATP-dependent RNA helicase DeaD
MSSEPVASPSPPFGFRELALDERVLEALLDVGYESPSPIQAATIPHLLEGRDVLGQAQTGTGKTAAFALPILSQIDLARAVPQALVLAPTRELAIQVAEAFQRYAAHLPGFHVLPIYGGQSYQPQLASLKRGAHAVVGTPGRLVDHIKRGTLKLDALRTLVLDEADEMLRMGFIEDVEWILQQTPPQRQIALFSATMPTPIRRIAQTYLREPAEVTIRSKTTTAANIRQRYWIVSGTHKLDALTRILEAESFDGLLIFTRTKQATVELAEKLEARGYAAAALNGDMEQKQRERTIARLKEGQLDIVVATDVAARGLDVERIGHVVNYDIPTDTESYIHRIGRTGRAGRSGEAILFVAPRERHLLRAIERATRQSIAPMELPTVEMVNDRRIARFLQKITDTIAAGAGEPFRDLIEQYEREHNVPALDIAAALVQLAQGNRPLKPGRASIPPEAVTQAIEATIPPPREKTPPPPKPRRPLFDEISAAAFKAPPVADASPRHHKKKSPRDDEAVPMETFRIEVGHAHGVQPGNIVGAIANEAGLDSEYIGRIDIRDDHSYIDLPVGMPKKIFKDLQKVWVSGRQLRISRATAVPPKGAPPTHADRSKPKRPSR